MPAHGALVHVPEIFLEPTAMLGRRIRVLGMLQEYSPEDDLAVIEYGKQQLLVETRLLGPFPHRLRSVYQLIGDMDELEALPSNFEALAGRVRHPTKHTFPVLKAEVLRCVDGMDITLYAKAMDIFRDHFRARIEMNAQ